MPLSKPTLTTLLKNNIVAEASSAFTIEDAGKLNSFAEALASAIAEAVIDHIQSDALVIGTVTSGPGAGGDVTGTVT